MASQQQQRRPQKRRTSFAESRSSAADLFARRGGHADRKLGGFTIPEADTAEPSRTERLLRQPFALRRERTGDAFQAREGFLLFRVNGSNRIGVVYRLLVSALAPASLSPPPHLTTLHYSSPSISLTCVPGVQVVVANVLFGVLSGLGPILSPGSTPAAIQTGCVLCLQLGMAWISFRYVPDADRVVSYFAGTQFLLEGTSTAFLFAASILPMILSALGVGTSADTSANASSTDAGGIVDPPSRHTYLLLSAFWTGLFAVGVPVLQMVEQRCITPAVLVVRNKGGNPLALCACKLPRDDHTSGHVPYYIPPRPSPL